MESVTPVLQETLVRRFRDRSEAGRRLAERLVDYADRADVLVVALPRGGVPVGFEIAKLLGVPLDVLIVRKLGVPGQEELAVGAITNGGVQVVNEPLLQTFDLTEDDLDDIAAREKPELERRERLYREGRPALNVHGRTVILVDDGIATGSTLRAAIRAVRKQHPSRLIIAVPVAPASTCQQLRAEVDQLICLVAPELFIAIGMWYDDFSQTSDREVCGLLKKAEQARIAAAKVSTCEGR